jgi:hypothetical protein
MAILIDTHKTIQRLIEGGVEKRVAELFVEVFGQASQNVATKADLQDLKIWMLKAFLTQTLAIIAILVAILALLR